MDPCTAHDTIPAAAAAGGETKRFTTGDGTNYVYTYSAAATESQPTFLLLHGYPSGGYGVLAPDLLGMGDSDKPTHHLEAYGSKRISGHLKELLDHQEESPRSGKNVIGVGHDWGVAVLSKVAVWYPDRFSGLVFLSSAYFPPGVFFDLDAINRRTLGTLGYTQYGYWYFFNCFNASRLISEKLESFFHLLYHADAAQWGQNFAMVGAARAWLQAGTTQPLPPWLTEEDKALWLRLYSQPDAAEASLSYYRAVMRGVFEEDEAVLSDEDRKLKVPVVAIAGAKDQVSTPEDMTAVTKPYATGGYTEYLLDAGHWIMLEQKEKVTSILAEFAESLATTHQPGNTVTVRARVDNLIRYVNLSRDVLDHHGPTLLNNEGDAARPKLLTLDFPKGAKCLQVERGLGDDGLLTVRPLQIELKGIQGVSHRAIIDLDTFTMALAELPDNWTCPDGSRYADLARPESTVANEFKMQRDVAALGLGLAPEVLGLVTEKGRGVVGFLMEYFEDAQDFRELRATHGYKMTDVDKQGCRNALQVMHDRGFLHEDADPSNFLRLADGRIRIIHFENTQRVNGEGHVPGFPNRSLKTEWERDVEPWLTKY
ncbi:hypothetical protein PG984_004716 [Apiospora sp. TS-2023a]